MLSILSDSSIFIQTIQNYPVSVEGAFDCDSLNVDSKSGNEMICCHALYKRLHYDFLPDFIVRFTGFDNKHKLFTQKITKICHFKDWVKDQRACDCVTLANK